MWGPPRSEATLTVPPAAGLVCVVCGEWTPLALHCSVFRLEEGKERDRSGSPQTREPAAAPALEDWRGRSAQRIGRTQLKMASAASTTFL